MVAALARTFRIDQDVGDVLHVAHFVCTLAHFQQGIEAGGARIGGIEQQAVREAGAPAGGEGPVLALDVVNDGGLVPRQQRGQYQTDAFAGPGRRHHQHVLGTIVPQIASVIETKHNAGIAEQRSRPDIRNVRPAGRAVGCCLLLAAGPPGGSPDRDGTAGEAAERGKGAGAREHVRRLGVERQPPDEQLPRRIDFQPDGIDPRWAECRLMSKHGGGPLRRSPQAHHDSECGDAKLQSVSSERHNRLLPSWRVQHR